jgi:hypothetical protein
VTRAVIFPSRTFSAAACQALTVDCGRSGDDGDGDFGEYKDGCKTDDDDDGTENDAEEKEEEERREEEEE